MRIGVASPFPIHPHEPWGGVATHTLFLCRLLKEEGHGVTVFTRAAGREGSGADIEGIREVFLPGIGSSEITRDWDRELKKAVAAAEKEEPFDLMVSQGLAARAIAAGDGLPGLAVVSFTHNFSLVHFRNSWQEVDGFRSMKSYFLRTVPRLVRRIYREEIPFWTRCRLVLTVSRLSAKRLKRFYGLPRERVEVFYNWVPTDRFKPDPEARKCLRRTLGIAEGATVFLSAGSLWRPKGVHVAISAFDLVADRFPEMRLLIAGSGKDENWLRSLAREQAASERIHFLGPVSREDIPALYAAADAFLLPSLLSEGHSVSLTEAMASGLAVIASDRGGNRETVGGAGRLVTPGSDDELALAMLSFAANPDLLKKASRLARERAEELFSIPAAKKSLARALSIALGK